MVISKFLKFFASIAVLMLPFIIPSCKRQPVSHSAKDHDARFKVIGYLPNRNLPAAANQVDFPKITHLYIAFVNPDSTGVLQNASGLLETARMAHSKGVKIMASIGGGGAPKYYPMFLTGQRKAKFIDDLVQLAVDTGLDGIDVDLEGALIDENYENFVVDLAAALHKQGKTITAAIATVYKHQFTDKALAQFDFVNIMSYDRTGPWRPDRPGPHAPFSMAEEDLDYWLNNRRIPKTKLTLGVPFYGYGFGGNAPESISYKNLLRQFPDSVMQDEMKFNGGKLYYNGIPTIRKKTELAIETVSGVMIWQLLQDSTGTKSLLGEIDRVIRAR